MQRHNAGGNAASDQVDRQLEARGLQVVSPIKAKGSRYFIYRSFGIIATLQSSFSMADDAMRFVLSEEILCVSACLCA